MCFNSEMKTPPMTVNEEDSIARRVGPILRRHREAQHMTQEQEAKAAGLSPMCIHFIETNQRNPKIDTLERMCRPLNISLLMLLSEAANSRS